MRRIAIIICAVFAFAGNLFAADQVISLNGEWTLQYWEQPSKPVTTPDDMKRVNPQSIKASVPGNAQLDLYKAGVVKEDPYYANNVFELRKWEGYQWCYSRSFTAPSLADGETMQLHFGGIDCFADVYVNGKHVGSAANSMIDHYFDVTDAVKPGVTNDLKVIIRSTVLEGQKHLVGIFGIADYPSSETWFSRVPPHYVGWDIMPRLMGIGLWRDVELKVLGASHFRDVHHYVVSIDGAHNTMLVSDLQFSIPFSQLDHATAVVSVSLNGELKSKHEMKVTSSVLRIPNLIPNAELWWPRGYGDHPLYDVKTVILDDNGNQLACDEKRIGLRMVKLEKTEINKEDSPGKFCFYVNGERIYVRGTNWIPLDGFHSRDREKYEQAIALAADLDINMIRCWGGNTYEDSRFFELCDENGIMVWQDFAMACTFYSQRDEFARAIEQEVTSVVLKLRNHCSLALWSGNNEDDMYHRLVHGQLRYDPNDDRISRHVIPQVLYEFDFSRPYIPSSPYYSRETVALGGADKYKPEDHLWWIGHFKEPFYTESPAKFVSEIGMRACPNVETLKRMMPADSLKPRGKDGKWNSVWDGKTMRDFVSWLGNYEYQADYLEFISKQMKLAFGEEPTDMEDFVFASQATQAEAFKFWIEMWRSRKWDDKTGIMWWNLIEGWPNISTGIVDYYGAKKLAYYYVRNAHKPVCAMVSDVVRKGSLALIVANDTRAEASGEIEITDVETGKTVFRGKYTAPANGRADLGDLPQQSGKGVLKISYTVDGKKQENHYLYGEAPFNLKEYKKLLQKSNLFNLN